MAGNGGEWIEYRRLVLKEIESLHAEVSRLAATLAQQSAEAANMGAGGDAGGPQGAAGGAKPNDDVLDAEFEEVDDEKK